MCLVRHSWHGKVQNGTEDKLFGQEIRSSYETVMYLQKRPDFSFTFLVRILIIQKKNNHYLCRMFSNNKTLAVQ